MIRETRTPKATPAVTSDQWHVVHARYVAESEGPRPFARAIVSEHASRADAIRSARELLTTLRQDASARAQEQRDQVFVRRPGFVSLLLAPRGKAGRS